jgi:hypothetical protein
LEGGLGRRTGGSKHVLQFDAYEDLIAVERFVVQRAGIVIFMPQLLGVSLQQSEQIGETYTAQRFVGWWQFVENEGPPCVATYVPLAAMKASSQA